MMSYRTLYLEIFILKEERRINIMNKFIKLSVLGAASLIAATEAIAVTTDVDAQANFIEALQATTAQDINFGDVGFVAASAPTAGDAMNLGTDGNVAGAGNLSAEGGTVTAGQVTVSGSGAAIDVTCNATALLQEIGGETITMNNIQWDLNGTSAFGSAGFTCSGAAETNVAVTGTDTLNIGGTLDGSTYSGANYVAGVHSTTIGSGTAITFDITYN